MAPCCRRRLCAVWILTLALAAPLTAQKGRISLSAPPSEPAAPASQDSLLAGLRARLAALDSLPLPLLSAAAPALGSSVPSAFGLSRGRLGFGIALQERTRYRSGADGALGLVLGLGDPSVLGVDVGVTALDLRPDGDGGGFARRGAFRLKLHRRIAGGAVALGLDNVLGWGGTDTPSGVYALATQQFAIAPARGGPATEVFLSLGAGTGRFRPERAAGQDGPAVGVIAGATVRAADRLNLFAEWTGQDLAAGGSFVPLRGVPLVLTPALADLTGSAGDGARFVLAAGWLLPFLNLPFGR